MTGDAGRLRQVVDNLLENAASTPRPGRERRCACNRTRADAAIVVADDGPGMDPEVAGRAFERFYRGDPARARATGGAGLGLSIVAAIVEAHGGSVRVTDAPGTEIEVVLPVAQPAAQAS